MKNLSILTFFFLFSAASFAQQPQLIDKISAVVGNEIILHSDVEISALQVTEGATPSTEIRCQSLEDLLFQKLLVNQARIDSLEVSEVEIQATIQRRLDYFISIFGSIEEFEKWYGKSVPEWRDEFHDPIEEQLLARNAQQQLMGAVSITPGEVNDFFDKLPKDSLPLMSEQVQYSRISMDPKVADQERQSTIQFLDSIRVMLISGKSSMTSQAAKWSEDPGSKFGGGCYPMQQKGTFVPPYEEAVFTTPIGSYSEVFESEYGFHFVYVKNRQGNQYEACHILRIPKVDVAALDRSRNRLDSIGTLIKADSLSFKVAVSKFSTDEETRNQEGRVINPETGGTSFDINAISDPNILLTLNTLKVGGISEPIRITKKDGSQAWVIFRLDKRIPAHKANLKDDYLIFKDQAEANKQQEVLLDWVAKQVQKTYVQIDEDFTPCTFQFDWSTAKGTQSH